MQRISGRIRFWKYQMHVAGVVLELLFALVHLTSFWQEILWRASGQQIYAFALGILYAYWREKSGSLLAPIVGQRGRRGGVRFDVFDETGLALTGERGPS
jgi:uncharacterized protein